MGFSLIAHLEPEISYFLYTFKMKTKEQKQTFWKRNKKDITAILLAEVGVVVMAVVWVWIF